MATDAEKAAAKEHQAAMARAIKELEDECAKQLDGINAEHVTPDDEAEIVVGMLGLANGLHATSRQIRAALARFQARVDAAKAKRV